jgi:hypothetical protein
MSDLTFVQYDTAPSVFGTIAINGVAVDLTGCTVTFQMWPSNSLRLKVDGAASVITPAAGTVKYDWAQYDLSMPGDFVSRWRVVFPGGRIEHTEPENTITVDPA